MLTRSARRITSAWFDPVTVNPMAANQARLPSLPRATTVRHTPLQAIEAPIAMVSGS